MRPRASGGRWRGCAGRGDHWRVPAPLVHLAAAPAVPRTAAYTLLLLAHVACAVVGFGSVGISGAYAAAAAAGPQGPRADAARRYFAPGFNWAGRVLYGVPVFGFALLAASHGAFGDGDTFVVAGLALWTVAVVVAEAAMWPAERRIQEALAGGREETGAEGVTPSLARDCRIVVVCSVLLVIVFLVATVLMVGKP